MIIGDVSIEAVVEQEFEPTLAFLFPDLDHSGLAQSPSLLPTDSGLARGALTLPIQSFVIKVDGLTVLVDTGIGERKARHRAEWNDLSDTGFLDKLALVGAAPDEVDLVICTHIHVDHVGWNTTWRDGVWFPTFERARYLLPEAELTHMQGLSPRPAYFEDSVLPLPDRQVEWIGLETEVAPGITTIALPGHSPGMIGLMIERAGQRAILCADALHSPFQVLRPDVSSSLCIDPALAVRTRLKLLETCADGGYLLIPAHLREYQGLRIHRAASGFEPEFVRA